MNNQIRINFHKLIDEIDSISLLEHFYLLMSKFTNDVRISSEIIKSDEYNYSEEVLLEER
jgi:hypothetical protein